MSKVVVKQNPEKETPVEVLADAIVAIAQGIKVLRGSRLNDKALHMLIAHAAPPVGTRPAQRISQRDVRAVLEGIASLEATFLKKPRA